MSRSPPHQPIPLRVRPFSRRSPFVHWVLTIRTCTVCHARRYSDRHFRRLSTLQQSVRLIDYTWAEMRIGDAAPGVETRRSLGDVHAIGDSPAAPAGAVSAEPAVLSEPEGTGMDADGAHAAVETPKKSGGARSKLHRKAGTTDGEESAMEVEPVVAPDPKTPVAAVTSKRSKRKSVAAVVDVDGAPNADSGATPEVMTSSRRKVKKPRRFGQSPVSSGQAMTPSAKSRKTPGRGKGGKPAE